MSFNESADLHEHTGGFFNEDLMTDVVQAKDCCLCQVRLKRPSADHHYGVTTSVHHKGGNADLVELWSQICGHDRPLEHGVVVVRNRQPWMAASCKSEARESRRRCSDSTGGK